MNHPFAVLWLDALYHWGSLEHIKDFKNNNLFLFWFLTRSFPCYFITLPNLVTSFYLTASDSNVLIPFLCFVISVKDSILFYTQLVMISDTYTSLSISEAVNIETYLLLPASSNPIVAVNLDKEMRSKV